MYSSFQPPPLILLWYLFILAHLQFYKFYTLEWIQNMFKQYTGDEISHRNFILFLPIIVNAAMTFYKSTTI